MYKIFTININDNIWQLEHVFGIPSIQTMIENRRHKFLIVFYIMTDIPLYLIF